MHEMVWPLNHSNALYLGILLCKAWVFEMNISLDVTTTAAMNCSLLSMHPPLCGHHLHLTVLWAQTFIPIGTLKVKFGWKRFTVFGEKVKTLIIVIHTHAGNCERDVDASHNWCDGEGVRMVRDRSGGGGDGERPSVWRRSAAWSIVDQ